MIMILCSIQGQQSAATQQAPKIWRDLDFCRNVGETLQIMVSIYFSDCWKDKQSNQLQTSRTSQQGSHFFWRGVQSKTSLISQSCHGNPSKRLAWGLNLSSNGVPYTSLFGALNQIACWWFTFLQGDIK